MKMIFKNKYVKFYQFNSEAEFKTFVTNQGTINKLILEEQGGEFWYCYVGYDSLTSDKLFIIGFDSDSKQEELNLLLWTNSNLMVLDNQNEVFIVADNMELIASYTIVTPLIGFYITESNSLLILEEAAMKLVSQNGDILKNEQFDLLDDYQIIDNQLCIKVGTVNKIIEL
ncbi:MAG: hypothetical protein JJT94_11715 [Bernardetiaceae bacterium]|nr:hypothetical protein [Bernardetiaceae bacterium]